MATSTPQQIGEQKEIILLWIMMTASSDYDPTAFESADDIVDGISQEMRTALGNGSDWNWPYLTRPNALQFAGQAFPNTAEEDTENGDNSISIDQEFEDVIGAFQNARSTQTGDGAPWPPDDGKSHPTVAEVAANLGLISVEN